MNLFCTGGVSLPEVLLAEEEGSEDAEMVVGALVTESVALMLGDRVDISVDAISVGELANREALSGAGGRGAACCVRALFAEGKALAPMSASVRFLFFDISRTVWRNGFAIK